MNRRLFFGLLGVFGAAFIPKCTYQVKGCVGRVGRAERAGRMIPRPRIGQIRYKKHVFNYSTTRVTIDE